MSFDIDILNNNDVYVIYNSVNNEVCSFFDEDSLIALEQKMNFKLNERFTLDEIEDFFDFHNLGSLDKIRSKFLN
jgi:hypothetical protein